MPLIEVESCDACPDCKTSPDYTEDSFERPEKWKCHNPKLKEKKIIVRYQEWNDPKPAIPKWCPRMPKVGTDDPIPD